MTSLIETFFYGSYINLDVLAESDIVPTEWRMAALPGYALHIGPLANVYKDAGRSVYGITVKTTHEELDRLYLHARDVLGGLYLPEAVIIQCEDLSLRPALCYISHDLKPGAADAAYVQRILGPATAYGFPEWYLQHIASFLPR